MKDLASHFEFGRNWSGYAELIDAERIEQARTGLERLAGTGGLAGKSLLDIGCGSGLHSLAALRLGAARIVAVDLDPQSVATSRQVLSQQAAGLAWEVLEKSVFDLDPAQLGTFDVVYAWGSLHHTGAMYEACRRAARLVSPGGLLILALYRKTRLCGLWKIEKKIYSRAPRFAQRAMRWLFVGAMRTAFFLTRRDFQKYREGYGQSFRGMNFDHDVHDWMGGYPYESISPAEAERFREKIGYLPVRSFVQPGTRVGVFGSGNDEFVWQRPA
jgi:2-polyprenyl-6-hydroxyphenyl methylase/3-demethylubiquinone-9 3-methyltransferase